MRQISLFISRTGRELLKWRFTAQVGEALGTNSSHSLRKAIPFPVLIGKRASGQPSRVCRKSPVDFTSPVAGGP